MSVVIYSLEYFSSLIVVIDFFFMYGILLCE